ncbi:hypothetical protein KIL84_015284 [Mauremys mutica]|uniref:Uncharacterized protein n=1 Tax=Mauremys mutica TaxID=74926 RepID=A0A9D3WRZ4_9SAUR|nr:hypothetical protein KIL84_015284 [Mauremys mutica]
MITLESWYSKNPTVHSKQAWQVQFRAAGYTKHDAAGPNVWIIPQHYGKTQSFIFRKLTRLPQYPSLAQASPPMEHARWTKVWESLLTASLSLPGSDTASAVQSSAHDNKQKKQAMDGQLTNSHSSETLFHCFSI